ncbi:MAG: tRNA pseudouridine(55) synthase TruB [Bacteroidales bacterium]|nr:tRNA pseudouridine(55) synthase TruB [Bacteroidales bacterium]
MTAEDLKAGKVVLVNKPYKWTSFQVVNKIKHVLRHNFDLKKIKIGHAGTLDPLATGLLIVCIGKETKCIEKYQASEKEYTGTFVLGATTPCFDMEKPIDATYPIDHITEKLITDMANTFVGEIEQVPPIFSAVKINGKRAFDYARNQEEVEIKAKKIFIKTFEITRIELPEVDFRIECSKGTYIRSIARDYGKALNSGAYLSRLCRERIGEFSLTSAMEIEEVSDYLTNTIVEVK